MMFDNLQWRDILQHSAGGIAMGFMAYLFWWPLLLLNAAFWIGREAYQRIDQGQSMSRMLMSNQVALEWGAPSILAPLVYLLLAWGA
jgi:hypothetical protein